MFFGSDSKTATPSRLCFVGTWCPLLLSSLLLKLPTFRRSEWLGARLCGKFIYCKSVVMALSFGVTPGIPENFRSSFED